MILPVSSAPILLRDNWNDLFKQATLTICLPCFGNTASVMTRAVSELGWTRDTVGPAPYRNITVLTESALTCMRWSELSSPSWLEQRRHWRSSSALWAVWHTEMLITVTTDKRRRTSRSLQDSKGASSSAVISLWFWKSVDICFCALGLCVCRLNRRVDAGGA